MRAPRTIAGRGRQHAAQPMADPLHREFEAVAAAIRFAVTTLSVSDMPVSKDI